jgi:hypothetical protein
VDDGVGDAEDIWVDPPLGGDPTLISRSEGFREDVPRIHYLRVNEAKDYFFEVRDAVDDVVADKKLAEDVESSEQEVEGNIGPAIAMM